MNKIWEQIKIQDESKMCDLRRIVQNVTFFVQLSMNGVYFKKIVCFFLYSNGLKNNSRIFFLSKSKVQKNKLK